ncbi:hypothetical protein LP2241_10088 [Pseudolactococcus piscium]|nr:hypothetical protein LP2241_10088 [Lactococcus piscium]
MILARLIAFTPDNNYQNITDTLNSSLYLLAPVFGNTVPFFIVIFAVIAMLIIDTIMDNNYLFTQIYTRIDLLKYFQHNY